MTRRSHALLLAVLASLAFAAFLPAQSGAVIVGIGDQRGDSFGQPLFRSLGVNRTRLIVPYNVALSSKGRARVKDWYTKARAAHLEPSVAFERAAGSKCPRRPCSLPSVRSYTRAVKTFRRKFRGIKVFNAWNEANSPTQPTGRYPKRAAEYYNAFKKLCRGCKIVAADILDLGANKSSGRARISKYVRTFQKYAKPRPSLWGFHNYGDTNYQRTVGTRLFLKLTRGEVWLTETGGIVQFTTSAPLANYDEERQRKAAEFMYTLPRLSRRLKRLYIYQWQKNNPFDIFDAGLVRPDGSPRPAFDVVAAHKSLFR